MWIKIVTNFLMGFKIWSQVGELENDFQNYPMYVCFFIFILKVMYFNSICQLKSAFFFRIIFILKVMYFKNTCDHRPFWTSEVTLVLHVLSSTSPFLSLWGPAEALHPPSAEGANLGFPAKFGGFHKNSLPPPLPAPNKPIHPTPTLPSNS